MKKRRFQSGGDLSTVPASRQNIEQRTPSGVRPVASPVIPLEDDIRGGMKHGGELKSMKKPKKMAFGGPAGPMPNTVGNMPMNGMNPVPNPYPMSPMTGTMNQMGAMPRGPAMKKGGKVKRMAEGGGSLANSMKGEYPDRFRDTPYNAALTDSDNRIRNDYMMRDMIDANPLPNKEQNGLRARAIARKKGNAERNITKELQYQGAVARGENRAVNTQDQVDENRRRTPMLPLGYDPNNLPPVPRPKPPRSTLDKIGDIGQDAGRYLDDNLSFNPGMLFKKGGKVKKMAKGGMASASTYSDMTGGAAGGIGRLEKTSIAAKTKSQKLKKGGKVKGYADGNVVTADDDSAFGKAFANARRDKADAFMWRGKKYTTELAGPSAPIPRPKPKRATENTYGDSERGNGPGEYKSYGDSERGNSSGGAKTYGVPERGNSSGAAPRDFGEEARRDMIDRTSLMKPGEKMDPNSGIAGLVKRMADQMPDDRAVAEQRADMVRRTSMNPDEGMRKGGKAKMAKGGKAEVFEGSAKDMAQDKKMAKARGMTLKQWEKSSADVKHDTKEGMKKGGHVKGCTCMACGGKAKKMAMGGYASGGMSIAQDGMKGALRSKPSAMAKGGYAKGGKTEMHAKGCKCMACGGMAKMAKGGKVGLTFSKPLPGTKVSSKKIRATVSTAGANMKKDGMKGQLRAKASGAKASSMMKPLGMTKMASGGKVRGAGIAQRGTKFIGEV